jgi:predicted nucleotide-binding protein
MARAPQPAAKIAASLSPEQKKEGIERLLKRAQELEEFDPRSASSSYDPKVVALSHALDRTLIHIFGASTVEYDRYKDICSLGNPYMGGDDVPLATRQKYLEEDKLKALAVVKGIVEGFREDLEEFHAIVMVPSAIAEANRAAHLNKVFVVHGHDPGAKDAVARFLEKIELQAVILQEQPDQGLTIIEKFESYASQVGFAVVLLTPDDLGGPASAPAQVSRARQNVIFELGYFAGKLGRGRACLLRKGEVEIPSDLYGVIYTDMDGSDGWKFKLARELKAAGLKFDADKLLG